ncbi:hypothetical protein KL86PLE_90232 [uncultured Pleomorphomonas sp.]|uniref:Uncharacterized protein n=1 Tax=uncultured Pleomorphomonas sp. TaxID=442121 RepID=A0A212LNK8_9HYPH|nr:hypothetical protein KL86PLE_90232 [uncultured Pleomorphomonas sp.]
MARPGAGGAAGRPDRRHARPHRRCRPFQAVLRHGLAAAERSCLLWPRHRGQLAAGRGGRGAGRRGADRPRQGGRHPDGRADARRGPRPRRQPALRGAWRRPADRRRQALVAAGRGAGRLSECLRDDRRRGVPRRGARRLGLHPRQADRSRTWRMARQAQAGRPALYGGRGPRRLPRRPVEVPLSQRPRLLRDAGAAQGVSGVEGFGMGNSGAGRLYVPIAPFCPRSCAFAQEDRII